MLKIQESSINENDENANRNIINMEKNHGKAIEKPVVSHGVALGGAAAAALSLQKSMYPLTSLLTAPLLTNYNTLDPLADPILWTPFLPSGSSHHTSEVRSYLSIYDGNHRLQRFTTTYLLMSIIASLLLQVTKTETSCSTYSYLPQEK